MKTKKCCLIFFFLSFTILATTQTSPAQQLPVIDIHLHATNEDSNTVELELEQMEKYNVVLAVLSGADRQLAAQWKASAPDKFMIGPSFPCTDGIYPRMYPCFEENNGWPDIGWLRDQYESGSMSVMGEMIYVYYGILPTDKRLEPYFSLAEEFSIPVGVHAGHGPPPYARLPGCCPNFNEEMGNPLLLKPVLDKYPNLRVWLMHGGEVNFHEQAIDLMKSYPNVYADMSVVNSVMPVELHAQFLQNFIQAGLEDRMMFGSDNVPIDPIIKRLQSFDFLTDKQRRKILYENAASFLRLSEETIARHNGK